MPIPDIRDLIAKKLSLHPLILNIINTKIMESEKPSCLPKLAEMLKSLDEKISDPRYGSGDPTMAQWVEKAKMIRHRLEESLEKEKSAVANNDVNLSSKIVAELEYEVSELMLTDPLSTITKA